MCNSLSLLFFQTQIRPTEASAQNLPYPAQRTSPFPAPSWWKLAWLTARPGGRRPLHLHRTLCDRDRHLLLRRRLDPHLAVPLLQHAQRGAAAAPARAPPVHADPGLGRLRGGAAALAPAVQLRRRRPAGEPPAALGAPGLVRAGPAGAHGHGRGRDAAA